MALPRFLVLLLVSVGMLVTSDIADYKEYYFEQPVDQFNYVAFGNQTYKQRYLVNDQWWLKGKGPIFFYTGNEGSIVSFWNNTGLVFDLAPKFQALVIFAEHRFYGDSLPFGSASFDPKHVGLLTIDQALADYAVLLTALKPKYNATRCPVIAFGGSYGGMLSAYMRFKYPHLIDGAIAASAPVYLIAGFSSRQDFFADVTRVFRDISHKCENRVRQAFADVDSWAKQGSAGLAKISKLFQLCSPLSGQIDYRHLLMWARDAFTNLAMMNYPYPADFMGHFPAFPVKYSCTKISKASSAAQGLKDIIDIFYNQTQDVRCHDIYAEFLECSDPTGCGTGTDGSAWDFQGCSMILPDGTNNVTDMFPVLPFTMEQRDDFCQSRWNMKPRNNWLAADMFVPGLKGASNIVFSNGDLDPWMKGGVLHNISDSIISLVVKGGAHHLDLRGRNPADPPSVIEVRQLESMYIKKWVTQARRKY